MAAYKVKIFPAAEQDLEELVAYLNTLSHEAAIRYFDKLTEEISSLSEMPQRCPRPRDLALAAKGYRYLIVGNYLVFYVVEEITNSYYETEAALTSVGAVSPARSQKTR